MGMKVHFSSNKIEWETPQDLFDELNKKHRFTLDVCALPENAKCERYFTPEDNGLLQQWSGACWMNPPYGRQIKHWVEKAYRSVRSGSADVVVCLVPARTDTGWWHDYCAKGEVEFIRGRLRFGGSKHNAPFPSALVTFGG
jgi:phage N-6-adenine-methyltransferase